MLRRLRCQVLPKLGSTAGPRALGTKPGKSRNEAAMGSGRVKNRFNIVPKMDPPKLPGGPQAGLGRPPKSTPEDPKGPKSNPEGAKMASWRPLGGFWAPGLPQVAAKAALRPHVGGSCGPLGGSWGRLGAPLAPLGALLGLPGGSPEARWGAPGGHFGRILKVDPGSRENHNVLTFLVA